MNPGPEIKQSGIVSTFNAQLFFAQTLRDTPKEDAGAVIAHLESQFPNSLVRNSPEESVIVINVDKIPTAVLQAEVDFMRSCGALPKEVDWEIYLPPVDVAPGERRKQTIALPGGPLPNPGYRGKDAVIETKDSPSQKVKVQISFSEDGCRKIYGASWDWPSSNARP